MDWSRYKALCDTPDVVSRWLLEQTLELVSEPALAARLRDGLGVTPLPKPADHRGGEATDMLPLTLELSEVRALRRRVEQAAAAGRTTRATRSRGLGGFIEAWREYERFLERHHGGRDCSPRS